MRNVLLVTCFIFFAASVVAQSRGRAPKNEFEQLSSAVFKASSAKDYASLADLCPKFYELIPKGKSSELWTAGSTVFNLANALIKLGRQPEVEAWLKRYQDDFSGAREFKELVLPTLEGFRTYVGIPAIGTEMPDFTIKPQVGKGFLFSSLKGKVILVDFWATWCAPCVKEIPALQAAYSKFKDKGFEIVSISSDENDRDVQSFLRSNRVRWINHHDGTSRFNGRLFTRFGISSIPMNFLVDRDGKVVASDLSAAELEQKLSELTK